MPQLVEVEVYTFSELDDDAKERARDWYRDCSNVDAELFVENVIEDFERVCGILGVELSQRRGKPTVYYSGFYSQGDGASFTGFYSYQKGALKQIKEYAPEDRKLHEIAAALQDVQRVNFYNLYANVSCSSRYSHSGTMEVIVERNDERELTDCADDSVTDSLRSLADWLYRQLEKEYEYQNSDECVDEMIECNEYAFDVDGHRASV